MNPTLANIKQRLAVKLEEHFDELSEHIRKHQREGRVVVFRFSAKITPELIEYSSGVSVAGVKSPKDSDKLDDPKQPNLEGVE